MFILFQGKFTIEIAFLSQRLSLVLEFLDVMPEFLGEVFWPVPCSTALSQSYKFVINTLILDLKHQGEGLARKQLETTHKDNLLLAGLGGTRVVRVHRDLRLSV